MPPRITRFVAMSARKIGIPVEDSSWSVGHASTTTSARSATRRKWNN